MLGGYNSYNILLNSELKYTSLKKKKYTSLQLNFTKPRSFIAKQEPSDFKEGSVNILKNLILGPRPGTAKEGGSTEDRDLEFINATGF